MVRTAVGRSARFFLQVIRLDFVFRAMGGAERGLEWLRAYSQDAPYVVVGLSQF